MIVDREAVVTFFLWLCLFAWIGGIVVAKGFWLTALALFPPAGIYMFASAVCRLLGLSS